MDTNDTNISIIYEDDSVLVINKPAGLMVHGDGRSDEPTLVDWLLEKYPDIRNVGEPDLELRSTNYGLRTIPRSGIVHRLDRDTSGVMVIAKTQDAYDFLKKQFSAIRVGGPANRVAGRIPTIEKKYLALVYGNIVEDEGVIDRPIGKSKKDFRQRSAASGARGTLRSAITEWKVLERYKHSNILQNVRVFDGGDFTLLEVKPKTGRTHQIRVHLKLISHPIVCDRLYAANHACPIFEGGMTRQALHAASLDLTLPDGDQRTFEAPLPSDFQATIDYLSQA